ncbi:branched-chain-amino-acid aminotransferase, cytosolic [Phlebotomus argentipes]|uniref:branched-chain-amino-acid aminotransferase, cytosolic n=1 Tax=Phlebotomus argentipes TaxID=94469 RepID=UPI0028936732|nr:branched-chain-amino-acid aminotransferase, cytosolic [Phlebotomus argentipes]
MVIRSKHLCRRVLENQHKLCQFLQQQLRLCSSNAARPAAAFANQDEESNIKITKHFKSTATSLLEPIEHAPNVGQQFQYSDMSVRLAAPHELQTKPDVDDMGFGKIFTDHMLKIFHHQSLGGWQKPEITPLENLVMHPAAKVFHYAVELFEGMKAYRGVDGKIRLFRPDMNMKRMNLTARRCGLPTFEGLELVKCLARLVSIDQEWVPHTECASLYIRPTLIGIEPTLGVASSDSALLYTILSPVGSYFGPKSTGGVSLLADPQYVRAWPGGAGDRKLGSNYAPTIYVQQAAAKQGLQQVLWLYGEDHQLTEVGVMNVFMVYINDNGEKELITPPLNGLILPGVTRDSILELSRSWGQYQVREGKITMKWVQQLIKEERLLEMFGAGTACVVCPVQSISYLGEELLIPTLEQEKPVFDQLRTTMTDIQYGKLDHPWALVVD